ncbi:SDR family oxidoreductase [Pseudaminobacter arsenicus]|uniref:SDR family oxidoreductase n=1 Tax=Borborobacter arsenicus TaxID=1851146 RepID=A0A432V1C0_9HYPH|nr:SDR family oxidoreductase [Pseudaminobacter arsenicus]RUM96014.1 SDR family oxidoreductase [Pseudaminobacter arsenicus]
MDLGIRGRKALVLGGTQGLGHGIARAVAAEGVSVLIVGRNLERVQTVAAELAKSTGALVQGHAADLADPLAAADIAAAADRFGEVDILVNNGGGPAPGPVTAVDSGAWRKAFDTMVVSLVDLTNALLPGMRKRQWGRVLTIVSSGVEQPIPYLGVSNALRLSLRGWSKSLSNEVARDGVTVNCIAPGRISSDRVAQLDALAAQRSGKTVAEIAAEFSEAIPAGRYGRIEEFAAMATFLVSEQASYVTGSTIRVDGGFIRGI